MQHEFHCSTSTPNCETPCHPNGFKLDPFEGMNKPHCYINKLTRACNITRLIFKVMTDLHNCHSCTLLIGKWMTGQHPAQDNIRATASSTKHDSCRQQAETPRSPCTMRQQHGHDLPGMHPQFKDTCFMMAIACQSGCTAVLETLQEEPCCSRCRHCHQLLPFQRAALCCAVLQFPCHNMTPCWHGQGKAQLCECTTELS